MRYIPPTTPPIERFFRLTRINANSCWDWLGSQSNGYGQFILQGRPKVRIAPYRFIWEWINGPMPDGLEPDHTCNNRNCVNPQHVEPVTHSENQRRAYQRGRKTGKRARPTHCKQGHEYTPENVLRERPLQCRECNRIRCAAYARR